MRSAEKRRSAAARMAARGKAKAFGMARTNSAAICQRKNR